MTRHLLSALAACGALLGTLAGVPPTASAATVASCDGAGYSDPAIYDRAQDLAARIDASDLPDGPREGLRTEWVDLQSERSSVHTASDDWDAECSTARRAAAATKARVESFNARCAGPRAPDGCDAEREALGTESAERDAEQVRVGADAKDVNQQIIDFTEGLRKFIDDGERALARYFTGTKVYSLAAKSWIDASEITEWSMRGAKTLMEADSEPTGPDPNDDFRLYQSFVAEVTFRGGKVERARFVPGSLQQAAGRTKVPVPAIGGAAGRVRFVVLGVRGAIYVVDQRIEISPDHDSVVFSRKVEGHPSLWVLALDKLTLFGSLGTLPTIWNSLRLEASAEDASYEGDGSEFPSQRFWIDGEPFDSREQVQPSEYFTDPR